MEGPNMLPWHLEIIFVFKKASINQEILEAERRVPSVVPGKLTGMG